MTLVVNQSEEVYDNDGAKIVLKGINYSYEIVFGAISALYQSHQE